MNSRLIAISSLVLAGSLILAVAMMLSGDGDELGRITLDDHESVLRSRAPIDEIGDVLDHAVGVGGVLTFVARCASVRRAGHQRLLSEPARDAQQLG